MALPKIEPLGTEFDMPQGGGDAIKEEITKLGAVIIDNTSAGLKAATKAVIGDVPKMIADLTKEIESGPVDNFAFAINKLVKLVDDLGINLRDYNQELADTVEEFTGTQQKLEKKIAELREQGIRAEIAERGDAIKILTEKEIKEKEINIKENNKQLEISNKELKEFTNQLNQLDPVQTEERKVLEDRIEAESDHIEYLKLQNENLKKSTSTTADTGRDTGGFSQLSQIKEAFMVIPDTIADVATSFANVGKSVFGFIKMFKEPMKAFKSISTSLMGIGNIFKTARILIALKVLAVVAAIQFFAEKIDSIGNFFVGIWEKITGFFQGIVDWFKNSTVGKFFFGGKDKDEQEKAELGNRDPKAGTAGDIAGEASFADFDDGNAPVRNMSSARLEDGLEVTQTNLSDFDDNSANIIAQRQIADMDGVGTQEIDYTGIKGGTSLSQLGIKDRAVIGNQMKDDNVPELLKQLDQENAAFSTPNVTNIQNNSNVNSQQTSGTTVSGFVDHEPDTSFKYIRSGASGSDEF